MVGKGKVVGVKEKEEVGKEKEMRLRSKSSGYMCYYYPF